MLIYLLNFLMPLSLANCPEIDLNQNTVLSEIPIIDQSLTGLCYAAAASQLMEFELRSLEKINYSLSPVDVGLSSKTTGFLSRFSKSIDYGSIGSAITRSSEKGILTASCVESAIQSKLKGVELTEAELSAVIELIYVHRKSKSSDAVFNQSLNEELEDYIPACAIDPAWVKLKELNYWGKSTLKVFSSLLEECEKNRITIPKMEYRSMHQGTDEKMLTAIQITLKKKKPVGISFCYTSTSNKTVGLKGNSLRDLTKNISKDCGNHAALVVGSRMNQNQCEYLVRNSFGSKWEGNEGFNPCACRTSDGTYYQDCNSKTVSNPKQYESRTMLGCWTTEKNLGPNLMEVGEAL